MPKLPGADPRQSRTLEKIKAATPAEAQAWAAAGLLLAEAALDGRLVISDRLPAARRESTRLLIDDLAGLRDSLHASPEPLPATLAAPAESEVCHG